MASFSSRSSYSSGSPTRSSWLMSSSSGSSGLQAPGARGGSVYGGAGGLGVRISQASFNQDNLRILSHDDKATMQNLNDRLAKYLERVRSLELANAGLELNIRQLMETKFVPEARNWTAFEAEIYSIQNQISLATHGKASILLAIDNSKLTADDFKMKYENELAMHQLVDADTAGLKGVMDNLNQARNMLELDIEGLTATLFGMKNTHKEELLALRSQIGGRVNVEVDAKPQKDLSAVMDEIRSYYDGVAEKNKQELETWFHTQTAALNTKCSAEAVCLESTKSEFLHSQRTLQSLEIELQALHSTVQSLESNLGDTQGRYGSILAGYQRQVSTVEEQLTDMRDGLKSKKEQYQTLLDIKNRLELEIVEYRRLMDTER